MACIKKIQNTEVFGSKFSSRTLTTAGDISEFSFKAVVKNIIQGKILEIPGVKNAGTINFDFSQLQTLKKSTYNIEYWGDFGALGNEPFLLEELSIVSAENATNCSNSDNLNFEIKIEEISIPVNITKSINNFSLNIENLTPEQIALLKGEKGDKGAKGDAFSYADFTPAQITELQKPATDKAVELNQLETNLTNSESLRVQNENTRVSSENTRNTNEQSRITAENNRVTAETSRSSAENIRITAETERASNESERKTAETSCISAENTRATAETSRTNAETSRSNAENTRVSAENSRVSNENSRVTAENARITAENERIAAEIERQQNKTFNIKVTTPSSYVTGTMSETEVLRIEIPANSLSDSDVLRMPFLMINKVGTNGTIQIKGKMSTSTTMPSGGTDQLFQTAIVAATNQFVGLDRSFIIDDGKIKGFPSGHTAYTSSTISSNPILSKPFDRTVTNYLYISIILANTADQARLEGMQLTNS